MIELVVMTRDGLALFADPRPVRNFQMHANRCVFCDFKTVTATAPNVPNVRDPQPGDICMCLKCGEWNVLDKRLRFRKPTRAERAFIETDRECRAFRDTWVQMHKVKHDRRH